ncbi:hypothetical protein [Dipodfec virus UOA04_Rod_615]|nr:hypothetical protein [Dipodfec virus UOA04_Rod_615]
MRPQGYKITKPSTSKGYDCENETFTKYGKEILIKDYIQAGKEGTIASEIIAKAGGIANLKGANEELPTSDVVIDMNMDPYTANQIIKCGKIANEKLQKEMAIQAEINKLKQETIKENKGSENE